MKIAYKEIKDINPKDLQELFLSVQCSSGHYPEKLTIAMQNSRTVFTAWDGDKLIGLVNALDDGIMTAYIHFLLIDPKYQHMGIGKVLIDKVKEKYKEYLRIVLIAYDKETGFYQHLGFSVGEEKTPMFITTLWT